MHEMVLKSRSWRLKLRSQRQRILPPQAAKSPGALLSPCPASPSPLRWPLQRWPQQHRGTAARTSGNMAFGCSTHFCASRSVLLSPKDKLLCKIQKSRAWMGCFSDLNTHPAQMLFYFVPLLRWLLLFLLEMKSGNPESDEKEAGVSRVGGVEAR